MDNGNGFTIGSVQEDPQGHIMFHMVRLKGMLHLEMVGLKNRGQSALSQLRAIGYTGSREKIFAELQNDITNRQCKAALAARFNYSN